MIIDFFKPNSSYKGEVLISIPNNWAESSKLIDSLFAYEMKIEEKKLPPYGFSETFTSLNKKDEHPFAPYYLHCIVIYEDITDLMKSAKTNFMRESQKAQINSENNLFSEPLFFPNQENFYYPMVFGFKSMKNCNGEFLKLLEKMISILLSEEKIFDDECDTTFYKKMKFSSNLLFLLNNLSNPTPNTVIKYSIAFVMFFLIIN